MRSEGSKMLADPEVLDRVAFRCCWDKADARRSKTRLSNPRLTLPTECANYAQQIQIKTETIFEMRDAESRKGN